MPIRKLHSIFRPNRIALIGVSNAPDSLGFITLKNLVNSGFQGSVYPICKTREVVMGIPCFAKLEDLPNTPDLAVIMSAAEKVPEIINECGKAGIVGVVILSVGFKESGKRGKQLEKLVKEQVKRFPDMRAIGPNCHGIIVPGTNLNIGFSNVQPRKGKVAFISQSGALCASVLDWANEAKIGFSYFISIGNAVDVTFGDLIDYLGQDAGTKSIILYIESLTDARSFMSAARAVARKKPIIVYKAGRFPVSAAVAESHTGALASEDAIYDAVFRRAGLARVYDIGNIFDITDLVGGKRMPMGKGIAIVTNAGGPGVMATDSLISMGGNLATLSSETISKLNEVLPDYWSHGNPVDVLGDAPPLRIKQATSIVLDDENVDAVLVIISPQIHTNPIETAREIVDVSRHTSKFIMTAWLGGTSMQPGIDILTNAEIPVYKTPEQAIRSFMTITQYIENLELLYETPKDIPLSFHYDRENLREKYIGNIFNKSNILSENDSKLLINDYGISTTQPQLALSEKEAVEIAKNKGYPVVLKISSSDIMHKTDVGGVALNLENDQMVRATYNNMLATVSSKIPDAKIDGITVQKMIDTRDGVEMILGIKKDNLFGTVILVGMGGTSAELINDIRLEFPPLNERLASQMLKSLKMYPLLEGYRGSSPKNIDKLVEVLIRLSYLAADYPEIEELDINPLIVTPDNVIALDARIVVNSEISGKTNADYSHLILRPYPERLLLKSKLKDGTDVLLRPIKPEDETLWLEMLNSCSKETIYHRFRNNFHFNSHEVATRFCYIDYDREMGIVAEIVHKGIKKLIGVGRLIADPDLVTAEYAVLVTDDWQHNELGFLLTKYCIEIAKTAGLVSICGETTKDNKAMISVFGKLDFELNFNEDTTVSVSKKL